MGATQTKVDEFENVYRRDYEQQLESCDRWIKWCEQRKDTQGMDFYQGMRAALIFNDIKMYQLLRALRQESV
jgi:hypothetical protein